MPGARQPIEVLEARGKKHLGKAEIERRRSSQPRVREQVKRLVAPKWMPESLRPDFNRIANALLELMPSLIARTDAETIANYCVVYEAWKAATNEANAAIAQKRLEDAQSWSLIQDRYFKQARALASDLGLTISSRCRLVIPAAPVKAEENPFVKLMRREA